MSTASIFFLPSPTGRGVGVREPSRKVNAERAEPESLTRR